MEDKELEQILQEKADKIEMRPFSEVWKDIKGEVNAPKQEKEQKKFSWKRWFPILASAILVICIALSPVIIKSLSPNEELFFTDELIMQSVLEEEMFNGLSGANISHVDMSEYTFTNTFLYYTEDMQVKGAFAIFYNNNCYVEMEFYDKTDQLNLDIETLYNETCKVNSTEVLYKFKQEVGGTYEYSVYAINNNVQYVIEYTGISNNLSQFLNEFFG